MNFPSARLALSVFVCEAAGALAHLLWWTLGDLMHVALLVIVSLFRLSVMSTVTAFSGYARKLVSSIALTLLLLTSSAWAQQDAPAPVQVIQPARFDVLSALRDVAPGTVAPSRRGQYEIPNKVLPQRFAQKRALGRDPARQSFMGTRSTNAPSQNFDGLGNTDNETVIGGRIAPPDPELDVGEDHVLQMINLLLAVYDKETGALLLGPVENNAVFDGFGGDCEFDNTGDVISLYDEDASRWLVSHMSFGGNNPGTECIAISQTSDPTGAWYRYEFVISATANNDYPKLGVGTDAYYSSYNMFGPNGFLGGIAAAFDRNAMINGDPNATAILFGPNPNLFSLMPADVDGPMPSPSPGGLFAALFQDQFNIYQLDADFDTPSASSFNLIAELPTDPFDAELCPTPRGQCIPQPNGPALEAISERLMQRMQFRDMGDYQAMVVNHTVDATGDGTAGIRWYEFRDPVEDGTWEIYQQGTYAPDDGENRWMGSIAMDADGSIGLAYTVSSEQTHPSIRYTGRTPDAPLGTMPFVEQSIIEASVSQSGTARWGDYSAVDVDPTNGRTFWATHMYAADIGGALNWDTRIAAFAFDPDDDTDPGAITDLSAAQQTNDAELTWTAPADDGGDPASGSVASYDIRYSAAGPLDDTNFDVAPQVANPPAPSAPGATETFVVEDLEFDTEYWFAVRAIDDNLNTSLSNSPSVTIASGEPMIALDVTSLDFGEVLAGGTETLPFTIINESVGPLQVTGVASDNPAFTVSDTGPFTIPFEGTRTIDVTFAPSTTGPASGTVAVSSDDPDDPTVTVDVAGTGVPAPAITVNPASISSALQIGSTSTSTITVGNEGDADLTFQAFVMERMGDGTAAPRGPVQTRSSQGRTAELNAPQKSAPNIQAPGDVLNSAPFAPGSPLGITALPSGDIFVADLGANFGGTGETVRYDANLNVLNTFDAPTPDAGPTTGIAYDTENGTLWWLDDAAKVLIEGELDGTPTGRTISVTVSAGGLATGVEYDPATDLFFYIDIVADDIYAIDRQGDVQDGYPVPQTDFDEGEGLSGNGLDVIGPFLDVLVGSIDDGQVTASVVTDKLGNNTSSVTPLSGVGDSFINDIVRSRQMPDSLAFVVGNATSTIYAVEPDPLGPDFLTVAPARDTLSTGSQVDVTATFDASEQDVGTYEADVLFFSNDPDAPQAVAATLEVTNAPYPFALSPESHAVTIDVDEDEDETERREVTVENTTDEAQSFRIEVRGASGDAPPMSTPLTQATLARVDEALTAYARRQASREQMDPTQADPSRGSFKTPEKLIDLIGPLAPVNVTAYGSSIGFFGTFFEQFVSFDLGEPDQLQGFAPLPTLSLFAGDFLLGDDETFYAINSDNNAFLAVDVETGATTPIGTATPSTGDETWTELAVDPTDGTAYASTNTNLYTLDPETGEATLIGPFNTPDDETMIAIAVDTDGRIYGHGIDNSSAPDKLFRIDPETGAARLIGSTGVDAFFAQGMDYDPDTGQLYMAWYQGGGVGGLRTVDPETGASELVGSFQGDEIGFLAIPSAGFLFVDSNLLAGTLAPGASVTLDATVDAEGLIAGTYDADFVVVAEVPGEPEEAVRFTLEVIADPMAAVAPDALAFEDTFVNGTATQEVVLTNTGRDVLEVSGIAADDEVFSVTPSGPLTVQPGTSVPLTVAFTPLAVQEYSATLTIESDAPNAPTTVALTGTGIEAPVAVWEPTAFDVQAYAGQQYDRTLTLSNTGGNPLTFSTAEEVVEFPMPEPMSLFGQTLLDEDFDEGIPSTWEVIDNTGLGLVWQTNEAWERGNFTGGDGQSAAADSDAFGLVFEPYDTELRTPTMTAPSSDVMLEFKANYQDLDDAGNPGNSPLDQFAIGISTDGGTTWTNIDTWDSDFGALFSTPGVNPTISLAPYVVAGDEFRLRFRYYTNAEPGDIVFDWYAQIDDVVVKESFLVVEPNAGTIAPGETQTITYSLDARELPPGMYQVNSIYATNDPTAATRVIPFNLNVIEQLSVTPEPETGDDEVVHPNETFDVPLMVQSLDDLGVESYEFTLNFDGDKLEALGVETAGTLSEGVALATNISDGAIQVAAAENGETSAPDPLLFSLEGEGTLVVVTMRAKEALGTSDLILSEMIFNEGEPPATGNDASVEIAPLYGDVTLNLEVSAFDAAQALQYAVGALELSDVAITSGDVTGNGELTALDAALIFDFAVGRIDCFPAVEDCDDEATPALAMKQASSAAPSAELRWGAATAAATQTTAAKAAGEGSGQAIELPLTLHAVSGSVRALQITSTIDAEKVALDDVIANVPEDWQLAYHTMSDGRVRIALAGTTPLEGGRPLATLRLRWLQEDVQFEMGGETVVNEVHAHPIAATSITPIPETFALRGNYPNPFGQMTEIALDLPSAANVRIEIFDVLGRRVLVAHDGEMRAGTNRTVQIDGARLASGLYIYRVLADIDGERQMETGRMTLVR